MTNYGKVPQSISEKMNFFAAPLTNKSVIFVGNQKNSSIRLNKILSFTPYSNGIEINKDTGKNPIVTFNADMELFNLLG